MVTWTRYAPMSVGSLGVCFRVMGCSDFGIRMMGYPDFYLFSRFGRVGSCNLCDLALPSVSL